MADYKMMYLTLVDEVAITIDRLTAALQKAENIYIESDDTKIEIAELLKNKKINGRPLVARIKYNIITSYFSSAPDGQVSSCVAG